MTSLKGQVRYSCATGRFEKPVKAEFSNVSYKYMALIPYVATNRLVVDVQGEKQVT